MAEKTVQRNPELICSLEIGANVAILAATKNMKSRMKGDFHVRFCGKAGVRFPCLTRFPAIKTKQKVLK